MDPMELLMKCIIWNLATVQLEIVLVSVQDSCMVCAHMPRNPFGRTPMELLDDMCHIESRFGLFGDTVYGLHDRCTVGTFHANIFGSIQ